MWVTKLKKISSEIGHYAFIRDAQGMIQQVMAHVIQIETDLG